MTDQNQTPATEEEARKNEAASATQVPDALAADALTEGAAPLSDSAEPAPSSPDPAPTAPEPVASDEPTPAPQPEAPAPRESTPEDDRSLFEAALNAMETGEDVSELDGAFKKLSRGDRIEATVIQVDNDRLFVDLGTKSEGIVPLAELSTESIESAKDHFKVGDKINVVVLRPESAEGNPIVSKKRADFESTWDKIEEALKSQETVTAQVVDRVKGGLVVDIGVRGFVPATHVGSGKLRNIEKYVGQPLSLKVIEIDRERKKVVLSNRLAEEERRESAKAEIFDKVKPGEVLDGTVRRLTDYGAFIDLGGVDGLLHISEMSWMRISHPREMFKEGQTIKVMVLRLDEGAGKISLGHRQVLPDPWNLIRTNYNVNQKLTVTINRMVQSGAFVKLPEGAEAFMPVSEMSYRRIKRPEDVLEIGEEVEAQIIDLRPDERRMVLSIRAAGGGREERMGSAPVSDFDDEMRVERRKKKGGTGGGKRTGGGRIREVEDDFEEVLGSRRGFATSGATIGERLGMLKGFLTRDEDEDEIEAMDETPETSEEETSS